VLVSRSVSLSVHRSVHTSVCQYAHTLVHPCVSASVCVLVCCCIGVLFGQYYNSVLVSRSGWSVGLSVCRSVGKSERRSVSKRWCVGALERRSVCALMHPCARDSVHQYIGCICKSANARWCVGSS